MAVLILKPTESCNSACTYCDVVRKPTVRQVLSFELLDLLYQRIDEYLQSEPEARLEVIWHGGEPLTLGADYFRQAVELQRRRCPETQARLSHAIQSNLTLFSEAFAEPFRALGITQIGSSYDPSPQVRGPGPAIDSATYNRLFMRGEALAHRLGFTTGLIYVVTRRSLKDPLEVFRFLANLAPRGGFNLNPVLIYGDDPHGLAITPAEYAQFLGAILPWWWARRARYPSVEPFASFLKNYQGEGPSLGCVDSGRCAYEHLNVDPAGELSHCGRSSDWGLLSYGHLRDRSLQEVLADAQRHQLMARNTLLHDGPCQGCRFWSLCHGGCPLDGWAEGGSLMARTGWCEARRGFLKDFFEPVTGLRWEGGHA
jgi:radical SAM protein with 4Fe4S-binding SPASM domain